MANGYSLRRASNYYKGLDGKWKLHSVGVWDEKGYTRIFPTIEAAEQEAKERLRANHERRNADEENYTAYYKIYHGKEYIKTISE